jgi:hypothetical protein
MDLSSRRRKDRTRESRPKSGLFMFLVQTPQEGAVIMSSQSKPKSARCLRVATVFTGAAACAVGFGPAANAQPVPAQAGATPVPAQAGVTPAPGAAHHRTRFQVRPDGEERNCSAGKSTWFHLYTKSELGSHIEWCVGFSGFTPLSGIVTAQGFCGGNNSGSFLGSNGVWHHFGHGTTIYLFKAKNGFPGSVYEVEGVDIFSWKGPDKCPATDGGF